MKSWAKHPLRVTGRLLWPGGELLFAAINYVRQCAFQSRDSMLLARARWLQRSSRRMLNIFQVEMHVAGSTPPSALLVCNHLGFQSGPIAALSGGGFRLRAPFFTSHKSLCTAPRPLEIPIPHLQADQCTHQRKQCCIRHVLFPTAENLYAPFRVRSHSPVSFVATWM